jgi:ABC-type uncharacterized transport system permease subunit
MTYSLANFFSLACYLGAGAWLWRKLLRGEAAAMKTALRLLIAAGVLLHAVVLYHILPVNGGWNLSLTTAFSLVAWVVVVLYLLASFSRPVESLGVLVLPAAALTVLAAWIWPRELPLPVSNPWQTTHIVIAILAYSLLTLAAVQSLLLLVQEKKLRHRHPGGFINALPPMQTMETVMFQLIGIGFLLLSLTLVSGAIFAEARFGSPFRFTHHMVLAALAWVVYAILLFGRWRLGWRGRPAIRWTLGGFALLVLAYFGSKFVLEVLLGRV